MGGENVAGSVVSAEDLALLEALDAGLTYAEAAARVGCSERTVQRRMADEGFRANLAGLSSERWQHSTRRLRAAGSRAVATLEDLLGEAGERPGASVRLRAAMAILQLGHEIGETAELAEQVKELQRAIGIDPRTMQKARAT